MKAMGSIVPLALRALAWRTTPNPQAVGLGSVIAWSAALFIAKLGLEYLQAATEPSFSPYGLNSLIALVALSMLTAFVFVPAGQRTTAAAALALLITVFDVMTEGVAPALLQVMPAAMRAWWSSSVGWALAVGLVSVWFVGAIAAVVRSLLPEPHISRPFLRAACIWIGLVAVAAALPLYPAYKPKDFQLVTANYWELVRAGFQVAGKDDEPPPRPVDRALVELAQAGLMEIAITGLAPQRPGKVDVYALGLAGWSDQDVFPRELDGALAATGKVLPIAARTLRLVNHPDHAFSTPAASRQNFAAAVRAIGRLMDKDEDVLLVFLTSHGSPDGVALRLTGAFEVDLSPEDVQSVLRDEGIRSRIVIVSACYSGVFVEPLANDDTIVLTAADADNPSFGCANDREWTYFGEALFARSLAAGKTLERAFTEAKDLITIWEARDKLPPSNPQGHFGEALLRKLAPLYVDSQRAEETAAPPRPEASGG